MSDTVQLLLGLSVSIVVLVFLLVKSRLNAFVCLIIGALLTGVLGGLEPVKVVDAIKVGFGNTMSSLGILIAFGVMIGKILEVSGATEAIGRALVKRLGSGREIVAIALTGFVTSLAIFCIPAFLIIFPLAKDISRRTGISINTLGIALAGGALWSHELVPPASAPIGGAGIFGANIAQTMIIGFLIGIPMVVFVVYYSKWIGKKYYRVPSSDGEGYIVNKSDFVKVEEEIATDKNLPHPMLSILPILTPVVLILLSNGLTSLNVTGTLKSVLSFLGAPIVALGLGLLLAIYLLARKFNRQETIKMLDEGIESGSKILLLIGTGGALGNVVNESGVGEIIANAVAGTSLPVILIPFIIATLLRLIQGSGSVAILTTASITAPIMHNLGVDPVLANLAACVGAMFFSYYNDGYFWTINESVGSKDGKEQIWTWSIPTTACWAIGGIEILILDMFM